MVRGVRGGEERRQDERRIYICKKRGGIWLEFLASRILLGNKQLDCTSTTSPFLHSEYINYRQYLRVCRAGHKIVISLLVTIIRYSLLVGNGHVMGRKSKGVTSKDLVLSHSNELTREPLTQFSSFFYRGSSQRRKSAACPKFDIVWLYRSPTPVERRGVISLFKCFLFAFATRFRICNDWQMTFSTIRQITF